MRTAVAGLLLLVSFSLFAQTTRPATTSNHDSCDIALIPAATLLLPYFELRTDAVSGAGPTTLFTVVNNSRYPQIAHVTIWTDWGYPVLNFNLFLTGYDVQGINLFDILVRGIVVPGVPSGTSISTRPGSLLNGYTFSADSKPLTNTANPNFVTTGPLNVSDRCLGLPGNLPVELLLAARRALTTGTGYAFPGGANCGAGRVGSNTGVMAKGYVTIDVVSTCTSQFPTDGNGSYFAGPDAPLLFDNVLSGDYQQIAPTPAGSAAAGAFDAQGGPLVHIHAVPEGGLSGASGAVPVGTELPFTFYDRYTPAAARTADRRQPLPSEWSARFIQGGYGGFATDLKIWREGLVAGAPDCTNASLEVNSYIAVTDIVRFDEHENSFGVGSYLTIPEYVPAHVTLPAASRVSTASEVFPYLATNDVGGWLYLNLNSRARDYRVYPDVCHAALSAQRAGYGRCGDAALGSSGSRTTSQNWVIASMFGAIGANRLSVDMDGIALGNGCTPAPAPRSAIAPASQRNGVICPNNTPALHCGAGTVAPPVNPP